MLIFTQLKIPTQKFTFSKNKATSVFLYKIMNSFGSEQCNTFFILIDRMCCELTLTYEICVDSRQISLGVGLMLRMLDLVSLACLVDLERYLPKSFFL